MIEHVNFLETQKIRMNYLMMFAILLVSLGVLTMVVSLQRLHVRFAHNQVRALKTEVEQLREKQEYLATTQAPQTINTLEQSMEKIRRWAPALNEISRHVPRGLWVTAIVASYPNTLQVQGQTWKLRSVSMFQSQLERSSVFEQVLLAASQKEQVGEGKPMLSFTLNCALKTL